MERKSKVRRGLAALLVCVLLAGEGALAQAAPAVPESTGIEAFKVEESRPDVWRPQKLYEVSAEEAAACQIQLQSEDAAEYDGDYTELLFLLEQKVKDALLEGEAETVVNLVDMRIDVAKYPDIFIDDFSPYVGEGIDVTTRMVQPEKDGPSYYHSITLDNGWSLEKTKEYFLNVEKKMEEIFGLVTDDMTDQEKALVIHDYLCEHAEYDTEAFEIDQAGGEPPRIAFRSGGVLMKGLGVCQSYANAYKYIMNQMGIECYFVSSEKMGHGWNMIKIGDSYYHVDCTWDDPTVDMLGRVRHENFLSSDDQITSGGHHDWEVSGVNEQIVCDDGQYDGAFWSEVTSPIVLDGGYAYYIQFADSSAQLYKRSLADGTAAPIKDLGQWKLGNEGYFLTGAYSGLFLHEGELYYNTSTEIRKIAPDGTKDALVYKPEDTAGADIYGIRRQGGELQYLLATGSMDVEGYIKQKGIYVAPADLMVHPEKISLDLTEENMEVGDSVLLHYSLDPAGAIAEITFTSSDPKVVQVDHLGEITAAAPGEAVVTAETDNGLKAECKVKVYGPLPFKDVDKNAPENWSYEGIAYVYRHGGIMTGETAEVFNQGKKIPRAQFAMTVYRLGGNGEKVEYTDIFPDVTIEAWCWEPVLWANRHQIINGYTHNGKFGPNDLVTREQIAVMLYRYANYRSYPVDQTADLGQLFKDADKVGENFRKAMEWAAGAGIITGKDGGTRIDPQGYATRAECATMLMRFMKKYEPEK